jgi:rfaE bifunctional protein nucleotidyltransferase chain/domain
MTPRAGSAKILSREDIAERFGQGRSVKVVFTNGCFDLLHVGHAMFLERARALGDVLVVAINTDASARRLAKGPGRPFVPDTDRALIIAALESVDAVCLFDEDTPAELIEELVPDVLVKGADYALDEVVGRDVVEAAGGRVELITLVEGRSTTGMLRHITEEQA